MRGSKQTRAFQSVCKPSLSLTSQREMNTLKAIQTSIPTTKHALLQTRKLPKKNFILSLCKSNDTGSESSSPSEGDIQKQNLLARIAMLQTQKVRLTDYLDEKSAYLTQFAEEANAEFDAIGENALKGLDEAEARIMGNLESQIQAFEETVDSTRLENEKNEKELEEFEDHMEEGRNEGLFFKSLGQSTPKKGVSTEGETEKLREITRKSAASNIRKNIYLGLIALTVVGIAGALISSSDWQKVAVLGTSLVALLSQLIYEQSVSSKREKEEEKK